MPCKNFNCGNPVTPFHEFCSKMCIAEYDKIMMSEFPDYEFRGERGRCQNCGSDKIETIEKKLLYDRKAGNVITNEEYTTHILDHEYKCKNCNEDGRDMVTSRTMPGSYVIAPYEVNLCHPSEYLDKDSCSGRYFAINPIEFKDVFNEPLLASCEVHLYYLYVDRLFSGEILHNVGIDRVNEVRELILNEILIHVL